MTPSSCLAASAILALAAGSPPAGPSCRADGWCWVNPTPQGNGLLDLYASAPDQAWAVGERGTLIQWDGQRWTLAESGVPERLRAIDGRGPQDVWAVGDDGAAIHFDGRSWTSHPLPERRVLRDVWVSPSGVAWTVGPDLVGRWDGQAWRLEARPDSPLETVWGTSDHDVWVGGGKTLCRWNGTDWSTIPWPSPLASKDVIQPDPSRIRGVAGDQIAVTFVPEGIESPQELTAFTWSGEAWQRLPASFSAPGGIWALSDLWVPQRDDVWLRVAFSRAPVPPYHLRRVNGRWTVLTENTEGLDGLDMSRLAGARDDDGWAVGECGGLAHWNGQRWQMASVNPAVVASTMPDPKPVHALSLGRARLSPRLDELWLEGRWPPGDEEVVPHWVRVDLEKRSVEAARAPRGVRSLRGTHRRLFKNRAGDSWALRDIGQEPGAATVVVHAIHGNAQPPVAFPHLGGAFVDGRGDFWGWGDCGTVITQRGGSGRASPSPSSLAPQP